LLEVAGPPSSFVTGWGSEAAASSVLRKEHCGGEEESTRGGEGRRLPRIKALLLSTAATACRATC